MANWNRLLKRTSLYLLFIVITSSAFAQEAESSLIFNPLRDNIADKLPALNALIDSAIQHSPLVKIE